VLELYQRCKAFHQTPSEAVGLSDNPWLAWQFDRAVYLFGSTVMARWNARDKDGKRVYASLEACMGLETKPKKLNVGALLARGGVRVKN